MQSYKLCALAIAAAFPLAAQAAVTVSFRAPASGATVSGTLQGAACEATGTDIKRVRFSVDGTALNEDGKSPYTCALDTSTLVNGPHTLTATAFDKRGNSVSAQVNINVQNVSAVPSAVPTFESLGLYWKPPVNPGAAGCTVQYRKSGEAEWKEGLALWYDARSGDCRGSLVHLTPDTTYEYEISASGSVAGGTARTWNENYPIAQVVHVTDMSQPLSITSGGTADGYVLYAPAPGTTATIDVANAHAHNIVISAPYVIVQGLVLKGAQSHAIELRQGARDLVITDNDISGWGRDSGRVSAEGWPIGMSGDSAIHAFCGTGPWLERAVIQRNRMHHPRYGSNSWSEGHPVGPNAVYFHECGGNHVFRHNEVYSEWGRYFVDGLGGAENFSTKGFPNADSDIYGNLIQHVWDDAIEAEGANRNVRIWGNYMDQTTTGIATTASHAGPVYIWRNVWNRARTYSHVALDSDQRNYMFKSGTQSGFGNGRRYVFHNTMLQADPLPGSLYPQGGGEGISGPTSTSVLTNTVSRNNILHIFKSWWPSIDTKGGSGNDLDFDLFNGTIQAYAGAEASGIRGTPIYAPGHGWTSESGGNYQLDASSLGYDQGVRLPNFNDGYTGGAPDMGAHEAATPAMRFGLR